MTPVGAAILCLSLNAYHESRGEPFVGQLAVSQVVLRRANYDPKRVCKEVYRASQFSWVPHSPKVRNRHAWRMAQRAARTAWLQAVVGGYTDHSNGADHYHATSVSPRWAQSMQRTAAIGDHIFFTSRKEGSK